MLRIKRAALVLVLALAGCNGTLTNYGSGPSATPTPAQTLSAANYLEANVVQFSTNANGNVAPTATIGGAATTIVGPRAVARDTAGKIYVADGDSHAIDIFAAGASGNVAPTARIVGSNTTLATPRGIGFDGSGNIYISNAGSDTVVVFAAGANGNVAPIRTIAGALTLIAGPQGIVVGSAGDFYDVQGDSNAILYFAAGASGNVAPTRNISGAATTLAAPEGLALDSSNTIYVASNGSSVLVFAAGATGNVAPIRSISGSSTTLNTFGARGIALDTAGNIYAGGSICGNLTIPSAVTVFAAGANGNVAPLRQITGALTTLNCMMGISVN
jgi:sugar lactone lactonase YvrE